MVTGYKIKDDRSRVHEEISVRGIYWTAGVLSHVLFLLVT